jgi:glycosyltransferase involved in cell wall biosynthesis
MSDKPKLVVMLSRFPFPLEKGDKLRAYYQIIEFSKTYDITLICTSENSVSTESKAELSQFCSEIHVFELPKWKSFTGAFKALLGSKPLQVGYFYSTKIHRSIQKILQEKKPDHIFCQLIRASEYVKNYHACPKTLDYMDAFSVGIKRRINLQPLYLKWLFRLESNRLAQYEREIYDYFEIQTIISDQDAKLLGSTVHQKVMCIPNGVSPFFLDHKSNRTPNHDIVFVGNLNYPPNIEAVKYILSDILPIAQKRGKQWKFLAAGAEPSKELRELFKKEKNAEIKGNIKDIRDAYCDGKVFVAPMKIGTGLQNKLLEAMALGIPCVTTKLANNALKAVENKEIKIAQTPDEFVDSIDILLNSDLGQTLRENSISFIKSNFDWVNITDQLIIAMQKA